MGFWVTICGDMNSTEKPHKNFRKTRASGETVPNYSPCIRALGLTQS